MIEEKKNKTLWRLEKIDMKSPNRQNGKMSATYNEENRGGMSSRKSF